MGRSHFIIKKYLSGENKKSAEYEKCQRTRQYFPLALIMNFHIVWLSLKERKPYGT